MKTNYLFLLLLSFLLTGCLDFFSSKPNCCGDMFCGNKYIPHPDNKKNTIDEKRKKVHIHNKTTTFYKNNALYCVSLQQEVATGKYKLLLQLDKYYPIKMHFFPDVAPGKTVVKKGIKHETENYFSSIFIDVTIKRELPPPSIFKDTDYTFFLAYLDGGSRKVFFAQAKDKTSYAVVVDELDQESRADGKCYHTKYWQAKKEFIEDTYITLEADKAMSNHKVVTHVTLGGKRIELATLPMKKIVLNDERL